MVFFFSSRRRHTRWTGDWSSDVCSSDLLTRGRPFFIVRTVATHELVDHRVERDGVAGRRQARGRPARSEQCPRSEERRVGKECRSRWWPYHQKKKKWTN